MGFTEEWSTRFAANLADEIRNTVPSGADVTAVGVGNDVLISVLDNRRVIQTYITFGNMIMALKYLFIRDEVLVEYVKKYPKLQKLIDHNKTLPVPITVYPPISDAVAIVKSLPLILSTSGNLHFVATERGEFEMQDPSSINKLISFLLHEV